MQVMLGKETGGGNQDMDKGWLTAYVLQNTGEELALLVLSISVCVTRCWQSSYARAILTNWFNL
jgi:hypothetical protein